MKLIVTLGLVVIVATCFCRSEDTNQNLRDVVQGTFSSKLYMDATKQRPVSANAIISPMSVKLILALALLGAGGSTEYQIMTALDLLQDQNRMKAGFEDLMQLLQSNSDMTVTVANKLFMADNYIINPTFLTEAQQVFQSSAENLDFQNKPESSIQEINAWVAAETNNTIQNLIPEGGISGDTVMVMVNTLYLKHSWKYAFREEETTQQPFWVTSSPNLTSRMVKMMDTTCFTKYQAFNGYQAVEMPYKGDAMSMLVLLPNAVDGLSELEAKMKDQDMSRISLSDMAKVRLWIPKFKLENTWILKPVLEELGMTEMFTDDANFTGISVPSPRVSFVIQKAFIEVNENGTTAAAATGVGMVVLSIQLPDPMPIEFRANHPFMFYIRETTTGAVLFSGKVADPEYFSD